MIRPNWTVLYNKLSKNSIWISRCKEFYTNEGYATARYQELRKEGSIAVPTVRPYHHEADREYLIEHQRRRAEDDNK